MRRLVELLYVGREIQIVTFLSVIFLFLSCDKERNDPLYTRLQQWDTFLSTHPEAVRDSLQTINPEHLSHAQSAYYGLLKTIADDKTYVDFTSDSLINEVEQYYNIHERACNHHVRSLLYLAIVRYRMGISDSTVMTPLKEAQNYFHQLQDQSPETGYIIHYYLGEVLTRNSQSKSASPYYQKTLDFAKTLNNKRYLYDAYTALFWCEMIQNNYHTGKRYLDTLQQFSHLSPDEKYAFYNAQSVYYDTQKASHKALQAKKEQLNLVLHLKHKKEFFRLYLSIADRYHDLNELDSALNYAHMAVSHITDTTYVFNYLLFDKVANIAEAKSDYLTANKNRKIATEMLVNNIDNNTQAVVVELEKKYALMEVENRALKVKQHNRQLLFLLVILLFSLILLYINFSRQKSLQKLKVERYEHERRESVLRGEYAEAERQSLQKQFELQRQILSTNTVFLRLYADQKQKILSLSSYLRSKNPHISEKLDSQLIENQKQLTQLTAQLFSPEKLKELLNLEKVPDCLSNNECLILTMLASKVDNAQIAALLNTTPESFKSRKNQLKRKIAQKLTDSADFSLLHDLF
jgi:DNA-binding CsgD family transcriptional regulator